MGITSFPLALRMVYQDRRYQGGAVLLGLIFVSGFSWVAELVRYIPGRGFFWEGTPLRLLEVLLLAASLGLGAPMQMYVLRKGRRRAGQPEREKPSPRQQGTRFLTRVMAPGVSGGVGLALGVVCVACCAPLLLPGILVFLSWTGSAILALHIHLEPWSGWLFLGSLVLCALTLFFVAHNVTATCALEQGKEPKRAGRTEEWHGRN